MRLVCFKTFLWVYIGKPEEEGKVFFISLDLSDKSKSFEMILFGN